MTASKGGTGCLRWHTFDAISSCPRSATISSLGVATFSGLNLLGDAAVDPQVPLIETVLACLCLANFSDHPHPARIRVVQARLREVVAHGVVALRAVVGVAVRVQVGLVDPETPRVAPSLGRRWISNMRGWLRKCDTDVWNEPLRPRRRTNA